MKIVVDARQISSRNSETGRYIEELSKWFPVLEPSWSWHFLFENKKAATRIFANKGFKDPVLTSYEIIPFENKPLAGQFLLGRKLRELKCDLFFLPDYNIPRFAFNSDKRAKDNFICVTSFQNVIHQLKSADTSSVKKQLLQISARQAIKQSAAVIAPSGTARNDIISEFGVSDSEKKKIYAVYNGVSEKFKPAENRFDQLGNFCKIILSVTNGAFDKDTVVLLKAFSELVRNKSLPRTRLVFIRADDSDDELLRHTIHNLGCESAVSILTGISQEDIANVCRESMLFVSPSAYEDFGQPIIDAMACGLPVICCNKGAQGEIVQNAAKVIPPDDVPMLADAIMHLLLDAKARKDLSERGIKRAAEFTWEKSARNIIEVFHDVLTDNGENK